MEANFSLFFELAIQLYEATLVSDDTKFDRVMKGFAEFTQAEKDGFTSFFGGGDCDRCHIGPEFTNHSVAEIRSGIVPQAPGFLPNFAIDRASFDGGNAFLDIGKLRGAPDKRASLVQFLLTLTDDRVKYEKAPFDHPQYFIPAGDGLQGTPDPLGFLPGEGCIELLAVGAAGRQAFISRPEFTDLHRHRPFPWLRTPPLTSHSCMIFWSRYNPDNSGASRDSAWNGWCLECNPVEERRP